MSEYWTNIDDFEQESNPGKDVRDKYNRRDFMKMLGFCLGSMAIVSSCEQPVRKAIPYLINPEEVTPGMSNYYASTFYEGGEYNSILVKVRDGRPIKIEGNPDSPVTFGGTSARVQGSVLGLYDEDRLKDPMKQGKVSDWNTISRSISSGLKEISDAGKKIFLITPTIISPTTNAILGQFQKKYPTAEIVSFDTVSGSAILAAHLQIFGERSIPTVNFQEIEVIVGFNCDFLGTWVDPVGFASRYIKRRSECDNFSHVHFEPGVTITGARADTRYPMNPSEELGLLKQLYNELAVITENEPINRDVLSDERIISLSELLLKDRGKSWIVSGTNDLRHQMLVCGINLMLGNYGNILDIKRPYMVKKGDDCKIAGLLEQLKTENGFAVLLFHTDPIPYCPDPQNWIQGIRNAALSVQIAIYPNESMDYVEYVCPSHHFLEAWSDAEPVKGSYSLGQPVIHPLFNTKQSQEILFTWMGVEGTYHDYLKNYWEKEILPKAFPEGVTMHTWYEILQKGVLDTANDIPFEHHSDFHSITQIDLQEDKPENNEIEWHLYVSNNLGDGSFGNNPWLRELPDPISRVSWNNYAAVSPKLARNFGLKTGDVIKISGGIEVPVIVQPGQASKTISMALGYGRKRSGEIASVEGFSAALLNRAHNGYRLLTGKGLEFKVTDKKKPLPRTQTQDRLYGREIVLEYPFDHSNNHDNQSIYKSYEHPGPHWGMVVDLEKCIGCHACQVACQIENNIPVVGSEEVLRAHDMSWLRIDRYYKGDEENPEILFQPLMCQHCDQAPCENVCPVSATSHSSEGLNQMAYNRCIGTRYCANNCPYKVRRFNWYDYNGADAIAGNLHDPHGMSRNLPRMVLNPDVTVRAKGVIEKCSFCVQRIQEVKNKARLENRKILDMEIQPACAQACPTKAIVFGDMNDPESTVSRLMSSNRRYRLLDELNTKPSVNYLARVRKASEKEVKS